MNDLGEALSTLANIHRRRVLLALLDHNPQAVREISLPDDGCIEGTEAEGFQVQMYHVHLPKLEAAGLIKWNRDDLQVVKGPEFDEIKPLLELLVNNAEVLPEGELQ